MSTHHRGATRHTLTNSDTDTVARQLSALFVELDMVQSEPAQSIVGSVETRAFGDFELLRTSMQGGGFRVARTRSLIARSTHNNFFIGCLLSGKARLAQAGHETDLHPTDIAILDSSSEYQIEAPGDLDALWVRVPRHRLEGRLSTPNRVLAHKVSGRSGLGQLTSQLLRSSLEQSDGISSHQALRVANAILDLLSLCLNTGPADTDRPAHALLRRVQRYVETHLDDPELSLGHIASAHNISVRYVNKLFACEGISAARWIRMRRLERCRSDLESLEQRSRTISEIAYSRGFGDISTFNRAFKREFGVPPGALRH